MRRISFGSQLREFYPKSIFPPLHLIQNYWLPVILELTRNDNDRLPEILSKISAPTTAGIVFGVGATSARLEADRRTQMNLRRVALLLLSSPQDAFSQHINLILERLVELITATTSSSPSAATRAEVFILLRTIFLKISTIHLGPLWPIVNAELQHALESVLPDDYRFDKYTNWSVIQAAKLLDTLVTLDLDEFQLHEWLYVSDTIDAVYRPRNLISTSLVDTLADSLADLKIDPTKSLTASPNPAADTTAPLSSAVISSANGPELRRPVLDVLLDAEAFDAADLRAMPKQDLAVRILRPFFGQLSMLAFEASYGMLKVNVKAVTDGLLRDIFEDSVGEVEMIR